MSTTQQHAHIERAADLIMQADGLVIAAGAGMGVDSGLPDFRGNDGFWKAYPALARARMEFSRIAAPASFEDTPALAWGFYGHRLALYRQTTPHPGFALLKYWGEKMPMGYSVFTSNVDGQFQKAGFAESRIHECHGSIHHLQCLLPCIPDIWSAEAFQPRVDHDNCLLLNKPPACPYCDGMTRPNILMFGDWNWVENRAALQGRAQTTWLKGVRRPVVIELGAGTTISSVRTFGQRVITHHGGRRIRINPREFAVTSPEEMGLAMGALAGLQAIAAVLGREWQPE